MLDLVSQGRDHLVLVFIIQVDLAYQSRVKFFQHFRRRELHYLSLQIDHFLLKELAVPVQVLETHAIRKAGTLLADIVLGRFVDTAGLLEVLLVGHAIVSWTIEYRLRRLVGRIWQFLDVELFLGGFEALVLERQIVHSHGAEVVTFDRLPVRPRRCDCHLGLAVLRDSLDLLELFLQDLQLVLIETGSVVLVLPLRLDRLKGSILCEFRFLAAAVRILLYPLVVYLTVEGLLLLGGQVKVLFPHRATDVWRGLYGLVCA